MTDGGARPRPNRGPGDTSVGLVAELPADVRRRAGLTVRRYAMTQPYPQAVARELVSMLGLAEEGSGG